MRPLAQNRRAKFDYEILKEFEAGIVLKGYEVKSVKNNRASLKGSYVVVHDEELFLINANIPLYEFAGDVKGYDPNRSRKLLLHKREISQLQGKAKTEGLTLVPLSMYNKKGKVKLLFGLAKGKKRYDKRQIIKEREDNIKIQREMKKRR